LCDKDGRQEEIEKIWLQRLKQGDRDWFDQLVLRYTDRIFAMCWRFTLNRQDAEDLTQDIFLLIYNKISQFQGRSALSTWIYRVALNKAISRRRREAQLANTVELDDAATATDGLADRMEKSIDIYRSIARLPRKYAQIIELYYFQDMSRQSIARVLHLPVRTVETRLYRGRNQLRSILLDAGYGEEDIDG